jgi:type I restriction enzyme, S subunit
MKTDLLQKNIPKEWEIKKIKDLLDFEQPTKYIVESSSYIPDGKIPVLTANKSFILGYTDEVDGVYTNIPAIIFDDFTTDSKYVNFPFKVKSSAIKILKNKNEHTDLKFVYEIMKSFTFPISNHKRHYISQYQELNIVVPPIEEQRKITDILSSVDEEIKKIEEIISATEKLKNGLMQSLLLLTKSKDIPKGWKIKKIKDICDNFDNKRVPISKDKREKGDIPYYGATGVVDYVSDYIFDEELLLVGEDGADWSKFANTAYLINGKSWVNNHAHVLKCVKVNPVFLKSYLNFHNLNRYISGSTRGKLTKGVLENILVLLPTEKEQEKIADILLSVDEKNIVNQKLKSKLLELKKGLVLDILSGNKKVKI